ncbi:DNA polymerase III alpha subunit [Rhodococcus phage ChewyVIII]|uniref:DNA polymerase III alpha subunit n=1 Tax=Rhodococcus phage ChewyVIII TaxID=1887657 RepID=A0A1C9EI90_9CAUD|nr:DNA polymerase III alpha subunit [Rhodococcus phage ChewyVIII]AON97493.1 DNA polymerase III alpha subunit [Rhodococcus phage ChewyVIII]
MEFVSLHNHTTFSLGDGFKRPQFHVERAVELGMSAMGVSEHGGISSHAQFEIWGEKLGIKIIFGCEFYVTEGPNLSKFHQTVFAMNEEGYRNLCRLVTRSYKEGFYKYPTVHTEWLMDPAQTAGLIVLSGCADSWLSCSILGGKSYGDRREDWEQEDAHRGRRLVERFQSVYGDRFYLETQRFPGLERSTILNQCFADISSMTGAKMAATADVHYPLPEQNAMQRILHAGSRSTGTVAAADASWEYDILLTYPESDEQIRGQFLEQELTTTEADSAIASTREIADRCNVVLPKSTPIIYKPRPGDEDPWV